MARGRLQKAWLRDMRLGAKPRGDKRLVLLSALLRINVVRAARGG